MTNPGTYDLNAAPPAGHKYTVTVQPNETEKDAWVRVIKDLTLFLCSIIFFGLLLWYCYERMSSATASADEKRWSMSVFTAMAGGLMGYLVKK